MQCSAEKYENMIKLLLIGGYQGVKKLLRPTPFGCTEPSSACKEHQAVARVVKQRQQAATKTKKP